MEKHIRREKPTRYVCACAARRSATRMPGCLPSLVLVALGVRTPRVTKQMERQPSGKAAELRTTSGLAVDTRYWSNYLSKVRSTLELPTSPRMGPQPAAKGGLPGPLSLLGCNHHLINN